MPPSAPGPRRATRGSGGRAIRPGKVLAIPTDRAPRRWSCPRHRSSGRSRCRASMISRPRGTWRGGGCRTPGGPRDADVEWAKRGRRWPRRPSVLDVRDQAAPESLVLHLGGKRTGVDEDPRRPRPARRADAARASSGGVDSRPRTPISGALRICAALSWS